MIFVCDGAGGKFGLMLNHNVHASMKNISYNKTETMIMAEDISISKCTCNVGDSGDEKVMYMYSLVPLYQLTLLLIGGYMAQHLLIQFTNRWGNISDELISDLPIECLRWALIRMVIATGHYTMIGIGATKFNIISLLY